MKTAPRLRILSLSLRLQLAVWASAASAAAQTSGVTFTKITGGDLVTDLAVTASAAVLDYDNDGDLDLFTANEISANNALYRNDGGGRFARTVESEVGPLVADGGDAESVTAVDYDNDGDLDLFVTNQGGPNFLYENRGDGKFDRITRGLIVTETSSSSYAAWADVDGDGWLDVFIVNRYSQDSFYRNESGRFNKQSGPHGLANIANNEEYTALFWDYDNDHDVDLHLPTRDEPDELFENDGSGEFQPIPASHPALPSGFTLAANPGDYDNDGDLDLHLARLGVDQFFINLGRGRFQLAAQTIGGINEGDFVTASSMWGDYDNDGFLDLVVVNHSNQRNRLFQNNRDGSFTEVLASPVSSDTGSSQAVIWFDYDNDGFLDLYVSNGFETNTAERDFLYHNGGNENHWLKVNLRGTTSNRSGIGAKIEVVAQIRGDRVSQIREVTTRSGWSGAGLRAHFGLGDASLVELVRVRWPSGLVQELRNIPAGQALLVTEPPRLQVTGRGELAIRAWDGMVFDFEASEHLIEWTPLGERTSVNQTAQYSDPQVSEHETRIYRASLRD